MTLASESKPDQNASPLGETLRKKLIELICMALPTAVIGRIVLWVIERFTSQPWQVIWIVVPLGVLSYFLWKAVRDKEHFKSKRSFVVFTCCYLLIFFALAGSSFLNLWERAPVGYQGKVPRNFLALNRAGDWRYFFARRTDSDGKFIVVTVDPVILDPKAADFTNKLVFSRLDIANVIRLGVMSGAKGIALDFHFDQNSEPLADQRLGSAIRSANDVGKPVYAGFGFHYNGSELIRDLIASNLQPYLSESDQGHLIGYAEWDGRIRMVPLYFRNDRSREALSLKIARILEDEDHKLHLPPDGLVQFIRPKTDIEELSYKDLTSDLQLREKLRDKFMLVGERSERDTFPTPYDMTPGVMVHAFTVHSLHESHFVHRAPWWSGFSIIFLGCYLIMNLFVRGACYRDIALIALLASTVIIGFSAAAMFLWLAWVDVVYALCAIWLLIPLLILLHRIRRRKELNSTLQSAAEPGAPALPSR